MIEKLARTAEQGFNGGGISVFKSQLSCLSALAVERSGNLYVAESNCYRVRRVDPNGFFTTIADAEKQARGGSATEAPWAAARDWPSIGRATSSFPIGGTIACGGSRRTVQSRPLPEQECLGASAKEAQPQRRPCTVKGNPRPWRVLPVVDP